MDYKQIDNIGQKIRIIIQDKIKTYYCTAKRHPHVCIKILINNEIWKYSNDLCFISPVFPQYYSEKRMCMSYWCIMITGILHE